MCVLRQAPETLKPTRGVHQEATQQASLVTTATAMEEAPGPHLMKEKVSCEGKGQSQPCLALETHYRYVWLHFHFLILNVMGAERLLCESAMQVHGIPW